MECKNMKFYTYEAVLLFIREMEEKNCIQTFVADSRSISCAMKRGVKRYMNPVLKFYEITFKCIHGGMRKSRSTGQRPNQSSYRQNCPFVLKLRVSSDGNSLDIVHLVDEHNHAHTKKTYSLLPRQRQLDASTKDLVKHILKLGANKKLVQAELPSSKDVVLPSSKDVTLMDLYNLARSRSSSVQESLESVLKYVQQKESCIVELVKDGDNAPLGLFYQDEEMRRVFSCYPEVLFVDSIYEVSNLKMPLYFFVVEDSNGDSEIISFFLAVREDIDTILKMVQLFKKYNPSWQKCKSITTDKDFPGREIFRKEFPHAPLLICLFHSLRAFRRELAAETLGLFPRERDVCLQLVQKMACAKNETEYMEHYNQMKSADLEPVIEYLEEKWHPIRNEWVVALQPAVSLGNKVNKLEILYSKIVQVIKKPSNLTDLFKDLDNLLLILRTEQDNKVAQTQLRIPVSIVVSHEDQQKYFKFLTPYAYELVADEFKYKDNVMVKGSVKRDPVTVMSGTETWTVSSDRCKCPFFVHMQLPCHHILQVRELKQLSLFSESLVAVRWTKNYYISNSRLASQANYEETVNLTNIASTRILSQHEKLHVVSDKIQKLISLTSEAPSELFLQRMKTLETLISFWEKNAEVSVNAVNEFFDDKDTQHLYVSHEVTVACDNSVASTEEAHNFSTQLSERLNAADSPNVSTESSVLEESIGGESEYILGLPQASSNVRSPSQLVSAVCPVNLSTLSDLPLMLSNVKKRRKSKENDKNVVDLSAKKLKRSRKKTPSKRLKPD